jgi:WD40 repeat protein
VGDAVGDLIGERGGFELHRAGDAVRKVTRDERALAAAAFHHLYAERILDSGRAGETVWLDVEPPRGQPLDEILRVQGPLPLRRFLPLYERVCQAIAAAHAAGFAHGGLTASSILVVSRRGQLLPKVVDFRGGQPADDLAALVRLAREALGDPDALAEPPASAGDLPGALRAAAGLGEAAAPPAIDDDVRQQAILAAPQPIAEAVAALDGADDMLEALWQVVRTSVRWVGLCALAGRDRSGASSDAERTLLRKLRLFGLSSREWVDLAREALRPFGARADAHPLPELVSLFFDDAGADRRSPFDAVLEEHPDSQTHALPDGAQALADITPAISALLEGIGFLADYPLAIPHGDRAELWMGIRHSPRRALPLALAAPVLTDGDGAPLLPLAPYVQAEPLFPGGPAELFLLEGKGRRGARFLALPGDLEREDERVWAHIGVDDEPAGEPGPALERSPFPGLAPYTADDAALFFGREHEILRCANRLRTRPILAVIGPPGAGKRSFVQAGLVPALPEDWRAVVIRPGRHPVAALAERLDAQGIDAPTADPDAFGAALRATARPGVLVLVVVKLEEIFGKRVDDAERERFAALLAAAARDVADPVRVVVTLPDDLFLQADALSGLRDRLTFEILRPPPAADLERIVVSAAGRAGYTFADDDLARDAAAAAAKTPAPLLALSFIGRQMWQERDGRTLSRRGLDAADRQLTAGTLVDGDDGLELVQELVAEAGREGPPFGTELAAAAARWDELERAPEALWRGERAEDLRRWLVKDPTPLGEPIDAFVRASVATRGGAWRWIAAAVVGALVGTGAAALSLSSAGPTAPPAGAPDRQLADTVTRAYAGEGRRLVLAGDPALGLVYLAEAYGRGARGPAVELALAWALETTAAEIVDLRHNDVVTGAAFSPDGKRLLTSSWDATARLWDAASGTLLLTLPHDQPIYATAFSPDGASIATAGADGKARVFDSQTGALRQTLAGHEDRIRGVAFSPDGKKLVTAGGDATARIWDAATGAPLATLTGHKRGVTQAIFSADGTRVATAGADGTARIWDAATGRPLVTLAGHDDVVNAIALTRDGALAVTASDDGSARVWDARTGRVRARLDHRAEVVSAAFGPSGERIVTASADKTAKVWDAATGRLLFAMSGHQGAVTQAAFSPDGRRIATASEDRTVQLWDTETGRRLARLTGHGGRVSTVAWSPSGTRLASASHDGLAIVWNGEPETPAVGLRGHAGALTWAAFSPDGARAVTAGTDRVAKVWDVSSARELATLAGHADAVLRAAFSPDGKTIVTASLDKTARLWDAATGAPIATLAGHAGPVLDATFSPDGTRVATAGWDRTAILWDAKTGAEVRALAGFHDKVYGVTFSPDGARLVAATDGPARVFDARTGAEVETFPAKALLLRFDPAGRRLAGIGLDQSLRVWDVAARAPVAEMEGHIGDVEDVDISPDGRLLASAGADGTTKVWDAETGDLVLSLDQNGKRVTSATFSPDGRRLLTASADGTALLRTLPAFTLDPARLRGVVRCRVPYRLDDGRLVRVQPDPNACRGER